MDRRPFAGLVAMITGASSGIGEVTARQLAHRGCDLILAARRMDRLVSLADQIRSNEKDVSALSVQVDVTNPDQVQAAVAEGLKRFGKIDILFNNAGIGKLGWLEVLDTDSIERQIEVNLIGSILVTRAVLPGMQMRRQGHIIQMASIAGLVGSATYSIYAASKFGVRGFAEALRREVAAWGIAVSTIYPGAVMTSFAQEDIARRRTGLSTPKRMVLLPEDIANAVVRLVLRPQRAIVLPAIMRPVVWLNRVWPGLIDWAVTRFFVQPERVDAFAPATNNK
jgi:short-subunit dehydrogenase